MANYLDLGGLTEYDNRLKNYIDDLSMTNDEINSLCNEYLTDSYIGSGGSGRGISEALLEEVEGVNIE